MESEKEQNQKKKQRMKKRRRKCKKEKGEASHFLCDRVDLFCIYRHFVLLTIDMHNVKGGRNRNTIVNG
jgi:hypothetical protein